MQRKPRCGRVRRYIEVGRKGQGNLRLQGDDYQQQDGDAGGHFRPGSLKKAVQGPGNDGFQLCRKRHVGMGPWLEEE